jgi:hypothetical protein
MKRSKVYLSAIIIAAVLFSFIIGCDKTTTNPTGAVNCDSCLKAAGKASFLNDKLYKLSLTLQDYLALRKNPGPGAPPNMIVFQFVYEKGNAMPVTLKAFSARTNHTFKNPGVVSRYLVAFEEVNFLMPARAIFGDQQIRFRTAAGMTGLDNFLQAGGVDPDHPTPEQLTNTQLVFTPVLDDDGEHIRYDICIIRPNYCPQAGTPTQPSPPADANP